MDPELIGWVVFATVVPTMLALDLLVFNRRPHVLSMREASAWVAVWVSLGLGFGALVFLTRGTVSGTEYLTGYLLEYSLSMDNVFVFAMLFAYFGVPPEYRHRLLYWGVLGAIVFRAIFIVGGTLLLDTFHVLIYVLGAVLVFTGVKMATAKGEFGDPSKSRVVAVVRRLIPVTEGYHGDKFLTRVDGRLMATPMLVALAVVETSDIMFAIDSVPAVFAITTDTFIVFTSNAFAILGLRSLYFLLAGLIDRFRYLKLGLGAILIFAGAKMLLSDIYHVPALVSLGVILAVLMVAIAASLWATRGESLDPTTAPDVHD
ncbi:MAG TPA: TerC family protein [Candidatus Limnocylindria bacterium]|nr:TerC family protein [Candidatus Limnocylindria bacterium]